MIHEVILPRLGTNIDTGTVAGWNKAEGDAVKKGEALMEVETSKAVFTVEAERDGFLKRILCCEGETVAFTEPVALLTDVKDEDVSEYFEPRPNTASPPGRYHDLKRKELFASAPRSAPEKEMTARPGPTVRPAATPAARRLLREAGVDVAKVAGATGVRVVDEATARRFIAGKQVAVYGAGLGVKQIKEVMRFHPNLAVKGLFDDDPAVRGREIAGHEVLGGWDELERLATSGEVESVVITLHSEHRRKVHERIRERLPFVEILPLVDPRATLSEDVRISAGVLVEAGSVIGPDTYIGEGAIIDLGSVVCHDCHIGAHCHLSPGSVLSGVVRLEENVLVGVGASVNSQVTVGSNAVITPGSAVVSDVPPDVVVSGNPASVIGRSFRGGKGGEGAVEDGRGAGRERTGATAN